MAEGRQNACRIFGGRRHARAVVRDAKAAAHVDVIELDALDAQLLHQRHHRRGRALHRFEGDDLRPEMHVDADRMQAGLSGHLPIQRSRLLEAHAKLVDVKAGGDVRMRTGVDVGVDAHGHARAHSVCPGGAIDPLELSSGFGVDRLQTKLHGSIDLVGRLPHAGKDDIRRIETGPHGEIDLADGVRVDGTSELAQQPDDGERRIRFQRVMNPMWMARERRVQRLVRTADRLGTVDVERRPVRPRDVLERHSVAHQRGSIAKKSEHRG
jgi:hypothetical protein